MGHPNDRTLATGPPAAGVRSRSLLTCSRWAFAIGVLAFGVVPRAALAALCKADGEVCNTSRSCCGTSGNNGVCVKAVGAKFGVCCTPSAEVCDGRDNDCNGQVDDGLLCNDGFDCTTDSCVSGACQYTPHNDSCDDGDACTFDACDAGVGCIIILVPDSDLDGLCDEQDNCPTLYNPDQADWNNNGIGNACDCPCFSVADLNSVQWSGAGISGPFCTGSPSWSIQSHQTANGYSNIAVQDGEKCQLVLEFGPGAPASRVNTNERREEYAACVAIIRAKQDEPGLCGGS